MNKDVSKEKKGSQGQELFQAAQLSSVPIKRGSLKVICGSMFSGKTEELIRWLKRAEYARQQVMTVKHSIDCRAGMSVDSISSHEGRERRALSVGQDDESLQAIIKLSKDGINVVGIDEIQFFSPKIVSIINQLIADGIHVVVAGLDLDFRGEPFGVLPTLMALADEVVKIKAICVRCGNEAHHTQRLIDGRPAKYEDPVVMVGAEECYEARCRDCFVIKRSA